MNLLERIEHRLSTWIEGAFRRSIPRQIEPVEVGRALLAAVDRSKRISMACVYAPNRFSICLSEPDLADLSSLTRTLEAELKGVLQQKAEKDQLRFIGPISLVFLADPQLARGQLQVKAEFKEGEGADEATSEEALPIETRSYRKELFQAPCLAVEVGRAPQVVVPLKDGLTIGRSTQCDLVLDEPNVSRVHARIVRRSSQWLIVDNNSTNGLFVNGARVDSAPLKGGDRIQVGSAVIVYREPM